MDLNRLEPINDWTWRLPRHGRMRVDGVIYGDSGLVAAMDDKVGEQVANVAALPGIVGASFAMPDAHWGYGFPIGGVAAFDPDEGGIISAGGVGFDISCGVRTMPTGLTRAEVQARQAELAEALFRKVPAGTGQRGPLTFSDRELDAAMEGGAAWAVAQGFGRPEDLAFIEEGGRAAGAAPDEVSDRAKKRQRGEMGTLGSGNHYLEVQEVADLFDAEAAGAFGLAVGDVVATIHCGSRGLGHQVGTDYLGEMVTAAAGFGLDLPDRELACAPIASGLGRRYLGAMRAATNCALANREIIGHLVREVFADLFQTARLRLLYDVSHNTCKVEEHLWNGRRRTLFVHRKGATRSLGPGNAALPPSYRAIGQPVLIGGSMGTQSYILAGCADSEGKSFSSACHGAGRSLSRHAALRRWHGSGIIDDLARQGIIIRCPSLRGVAEEAPGAYKDVRAVVDAAEHAGLARKVARLRPFICIKG